MSDEIEVIVGCDPGAATGLCRVYPSVGFEAAWTLDHFSACDWLVDTIAHYGPRLVIATEDFIPRGGAKTWQPESVEVNGVVKWACWKHGARLAVQAVADAKMFVSNDRLKLIGWYSKHGQSDHARDAMRHTLLFMARAGLYDGTAVKWKQFDKQ